MKNQVQSHYCNLFSYFAEFKPYKIAALILSLIGLPSAVFADAYWVGGTSQDWNTGANWSTNPPGTQNYVITNATGNYPILSAASAFTPVDFFIGNGAGISGR